MADLSTPDPSRKKRKRLKEYNQVLPSDEELYDQNPHCKRSKKKTSNRFYLYCRYCRFKSNSPKTMKTHFGNEHNMDFIAPGEVQKGERQPPTPTTEVEEAPAGGNDARESFNSAISWFQQYNTMKTLVYAKHSNRFPFKDRATAVWKEVTQWLASHRPPAEITFLDGSILKGRLRQDCVVDDEMTNFYEFATGEKHSLPDFLTQPAGAASKPGVAPLGKKNS